MEENPVIKIDKIEEDGSLDTQLRPKLLMDFVGQKKVKDNLAVIIKAAVDRGDMLDHVIFSGPPGLGKTTLANIIANEIGTNIKGCTGPAITRGGDLAAILTNLESGQVLFIDEIHRLSKQVEEILYQALEDFRIDIVVGKGPGARSLKLDIPPFTMVGATTRLGLLSSPLRDRFGLDMRLDFYPPSELEDLILRSSKILNIQINRDAIVEIARRSRGTPRIANRLLKRVRDYVQVRHEGNYSLRDTPKRKIAGNSFEEGMSPKKNKGCPQSKITRELASTALDFFTVDKEGLGLIDNKILKVLVKDFNGKPLGLNTLAAAVGEEKNGLEEVYEPFLIQEGFILKTSKGRVATAKSFKHLGVEVTETLL